MVHSARCSLHRNPFLTLPSSDKALLATHPRELLDNTHNGNRFLMPTAFIQAQFSSRPCHVPETSANPG